MQTNIHALSGTRTHDPSNQPAKTHASDRTATVTGYNSFLSAQKRKLALVYVSDSQKIVCTSNAKIIPFGLRHTIYFEAYEYEAGNNVIMNLMRRVERKR
jgi:ketopantoate hydroxymethyltransferase